MGYQHQAVMLAEVLAYLQPKEGQILLDGTLGGAGHSSHLLRLVGDRGLLIGIDQDQDALAAARGRLNSISQRFRLFQSNYRDFDLCLQQLAIKQVDGILLDLGVSSFQLDAGERGFSYHQNAVLDMRMDQTTGISAEELVNTWSEKQLAAIFWSYGEERWSKRIAQFIVMAREQQPIKTTGELVNVIKAAIPKGARQEGGHPARKTFQAIRIAVNDELAVLQETLAKLPDYLKPGGRVAIITFHSLEDRMVKQAFKEHAAPCICPPDFPVCTCQQQPKLKIITKKPVVPSREEITDNPRARSAKLRVAERV